MAGTTFLDSRNRAYLRTKRILEGNGKYVVNDPATARNEKKMPLRVAQSFLCSMVPLNPNTTSYVFNVLDNQPNAGFNVITPQENRLKLQDVFFTSALGFFLVPYSLLSGSWLSLQFQPLTYPSGKLGGFGSLFPDLSALQGIWGGNLSVKVNGETVTPSWRLLDHMAINQTEVPFGSSTGASKENPYFDQQNCAEDGFIITEPNWIVNGGNNNLYEVDYGNNWSACVNGSSNSNVVTWSYSTLCIMLVWNGWLAQNASSIMDNS